MRTYLVQSCLGNGVVLDAEGLLVLREQGEDSCKRGEGGGQLVLQHVTVFLLQRAAGELLLNEFHHWSEVWIWAGHPQDDGVAITKPENAVLVSLLSAPFKIHTGGKRARWSPHLFLRCCTLPRQRNLPLTMMAILVQSASHSSMLHRDGPTTCCSSWLTDNNLYSFLFYVHLIHSNL